MQAKNELALTLVNMGVKLKPVAARALMITVTAMAITPLAIAFLPFWAALAIAAFLNIRALIVLGEMCMILEDLCKAATQIQTMITNAERSR